MAKGGAAEYAAINARVRVLYANLLTQSALNGLAEAADLNGLLAQLKRTSFGPYFEKVKDTELTPKRAAFQLRGRLADDYASIIRMAPDYTRPLLAQLYRHFEVDNLKALLRGILTGSKWDHVRYVLFPLGSFSVLPAQAMMEAGSVNAAVELLHGTAYAETLNHSMKRFNTEQNLFPLEAALDLHYWRILWKEVGKLPREDQVQAMRIIGGLVDFNNLMWSIRYRTYYRLSEEELINYTLPFGYRVHDEHIRAIAAGGDFSRVLARIFPRLGSFDTAASNDARVENVARAQSEAGKGLPQLETRLQQNVMAQCRSAFIGNPFHIGVLLGYLILDEFEVRNLTTLIEAKANQIAKGTFRPYLLVDAI